MYIVDDITVIDDFLPKDKFKQIKDTYFNPNFLWRLGPSLYEREDVILLQDRNMDVQAVHMMYYWKNEKHELERLFPIAPLMAKLGVTKKNIIRSKMNCNFCKETPIRSGWHVDVGTELLGKGMTAVYYITTNNGKTLFQTGEEVESLENRIVIFPNDRMHSPQYQTDFPLRIVLNLNWGVDNLENLL